MTRQTLLARKAIARYFAPINVNVAIDFCGDCLVIEPSTKGRPEFAGLQIIWFADGTIEFSEYQAGPDGRELHIFGEYRTINAAMARLLKGKKRPVRIID